MNKREYAQANKDWLEAKAKEEGVKALPKGIYYKVLNEGDQSSLQPLLGVLSRLTIQERPSTENSSIAAVGMFHWLAGYVTSLKVGSSPCSRCTSVTSGRCISQPRWVMVNFPNQAFLVAPR